MHLKISAGSNNEGYIQNPNANPPSHNDIRKPDI